MYRPILILLSLLFLIITPSAFAEFSENLSQGIIDYNDESYEEAIHFLTVARGEEPSNSEAAYYLGLAYKELGDIGEAEKNLEDAVRLKTNKKDVHYHLAKVYFSLGKNTEALSSLNNLDSPSGKADFLRARLLKKEGSNKKALILFEDAMAKDKSLTQRATYQIGQIHMVERRFEDAKESFNDVASLDPNSDYASYAKRYIDKMEEAKKKASKPYSFKAGFRSEYDSNVVLKPSDASFDDLITGEDDHKQTATFSGSYRFGSGKGWQVKTGYSFFATHYNTHKNFNFKSTTAQVAPTFVGEKAFASLNFTYNSTDVYKDKYIETSAFNPTVNYFATKNFMTSLRGKYFTKHFFRPSTVADTLDNDRDSTGGSIGLYAYKFFMNKAGFVNIGYDYMVEDTDGDYWAHSTNHGVVSFVVPIFSGKPKLSAYFDASEKIFDNDQIIYRKGVSSDRIGSREDRIYVSSGSYSYSFNKTTDLVLKYTRTRSDSNSLAYDYLKYVTSAGLDYRF